MCVHVIYAKPCRLVPFALHAKPMYVLVNLRQALSTHVIYASISVPLVAEPYDWFAAAAAGPLVAEPCEWFAAAVVGF